MAKCCDGGTMGRPRGSSRPRKGGIPTTSGYQPKSTPDRSNGYQPKDIR